MSEELKKLPKDVAAERGMVNVQIDGTWHQFPRGTRIIEACKTVGIDVPHYCYHPKLSSPGNCRMCLVQQGMPPRPAPGQAPVYGEDGYQAIQWIPRPLIACANTVAENMGIRTSGPVVESARHGVMEFLLSNHPLDCPICDKAGECRLQEYAVEYGKGVSRFEETKTKKPKHVDIGPRVILDDERCIMCSRCIRFMNEVVKEPVLGFTDRGSNTKIMVYPGKELNSNYSMNVTDVCPVGALTSKDFRFKMRVWFLKKTPSIDMSCGTGTNVWVHSRGNQIYRLTPRRNDSVNSAWMPDSSRLDFHQYESQNRLAAPSNWQRSLEDAISALKQFSSDEIAFIASGRQSNEELFLLKKLADKLGVTNIDIVSRQGENDGMLIVEDRNPNTTGAKVILGLETPGSKISSILNDVRNGKIKALFVCEEDLTEAAGWSIDDLKAVNRLVYMGCLVNATSSNSHVSFATASPYEQSGSMINVCGRLQKFEKAINAPEEIWESSDILQGLLKVTGQELKCSSAREIFAQLVQEIPAFQDVTWTKIGGQGIELIETGVKIPLLEDEAKRIASGQISNGLANVAPIEVVGGIRRCGSVVL